jgi:hypothetical protein
MKHEKIYAQAASHKAFVGEWSAARYLNPSPAASPALFLWLAGGKKIREQPASAPYFFVQAWRITAIFRL